MIKYASNTLLATEISFINSVANICEKLGADVTKVAEGMKLDRRIGQYAFLEAGVGYGGSCFPKDVKALIQIAHENGERFSILEAVEATNEAQKQSLLVKIQSLVGNDLATKRITLWGLAFKPQTDDLREAPSLVIIKQLLDRGAKVVAFDPIAREQAQKILGKAIDFETDCYQAARRADCLVVVTEWPEFKQVDLKKLKSVMKAPNLVDGRNIFDKETMKKMGWHYLSIGR
jgi:UDPglucose 6-dehydrogenase